MRGGAAAVILTWAQDNYKMAQKPYQHSSVNASLLRFDSANRELLRASLRLFPKGEASTSMRLLTGAAIKRNLSTSSAIKLLASVGNMQSSRSLLRVHLDTALRYSGAWLVDNPEAFASKVLGGHRIDAILDANGKKLTDRYLVQVRTVEYPWVAETYESLSGYVHFSINHLLDSFDVVGGDDPRIVFDPSPSEYRYADSDWVDVIDGASDVTTMLTQFVVKWIEGSSPVGNDR